MTHFTPNQLLTRKQAAEVLGTTEPTLAAWHCTKRYKIPCVKVGRLAKYRYSDLLDFIERRTVNKPTDEASNDNNSSAVR